MEVEIEKPATPGDKRDIQKELIKAVEDVKWVHSITRYEYREVYPEE